MVRGPSGPLFDMVDGGPDSTAAPGVPAGGDAELRRARSLVLRHGWNTMAYQVLSPGLERWFSDAGDAVVGYVRRGRIRVVAGAPVAAADRLAAVAGEFERASARAGDRVCYVGVAERLGSVYRRSAGHSVVQLGAQPYWRPDRWASIVAGHASLRAQLHRARNKGVVVREWPASRAASSPSLRRCLGEWLEMRRLPPLRFMVDPDTLDRLLDRRVLVAERGEEPVGFLILSPVPGRDGWIIEQIVRGSGAPNGTAESMIDAGMRLLSAEGASFATLGPAPLSRRAGDGTRQPGWLRTVLAGARATGRRFYHFDGLDTFKAKLRPEAWEPVYAIANEPRFSAGTLYAIVGAFCGRSPVGTLVRSIVGSVCRWPRRG